MKDILLLLYSLTWLGCVQIDKQKDNSEIVLNHVESYSKKSAKDTLFGEFLACLSDSSKPRIVSVADVMDIDYDTFGNDRFYHEIIEYSTNVKAINQMIDSFPKFEKSKDSFYQLITIIDERDLFFICGSDTFIRFFWKGYSSYDSKFEFLTNKGIYRADGRILFECLNRLERKKKYVYEKSFKKVH